jgi:hypothetical protein
VERYVEEVEMWSAGRCDVRCCKDRTHALPCFLVVRLIG